MGDFHKDKKHGYGIYTYPDGRSYKGQWANGKQHGEGIFITPLGAQRKGIWNEGKRIRWLDDNDNNNNEEAHNSLNKLNLIRQRENNLKIS